MTSEMLVVATGFPATMLLRLERRFSDASLTLERRLGVGRW